MKLRQSLKSSGHINQERISSTSGAQLKANR